MPPDRITLAIEIGAVALPVAGAIALFSETTPDLPDAIARDRLRVVSPSWPVIAQMQAHGISAAAHDGGPFAASIVRAGRSRAANRLAVGRAMLSTAPGGPVLVDGQKTDGIDALMRDIRDRVPVPDSFVKHHGRLLWLPADPTAFGDWARIAEDWPPVNGFRTAPGGFSADGPDPASVALADALPECLPPHVADLGAGWGYLALRILDRRDIETVNLVEANHDALTAARRNIADPRARFHWADATSWQPETPVDAVVMNPPFHSGRAADPRLGQAFLDAAARILARDGTLWLVANRTLPYEARIAALFGHVDTRDAPAGFKIIVARKPRRTPRGEGASQRQGAVP